MSCLVEAAPTHNLPHQDLDPAWYGGTNLPYDQTPDQLFCSPPPGSCSQRKLLVIPALSPRHFWTKSSLASEANLTRPLPEQCYVPAYLDSQNRRKLNQNKENFSPSINQVSCSNSFLSRRRRGCSRDSLGYRISFNTQHGF